jgi:hypothetical protein
MLPTGRYDSMKLQALHKTQKRLRSESPPYVLTGSEIQKVDVPEIGPFAKQVLRKQVGPDEARLEELDRIETRNQNAVNWLANASSKDKREAEDNLRRNPPLTVLQKVEMLRLQERLKAVGNNPGIFPQIDKVMQKMGVGRRRRSKTKKAGRKTRRGKGRVYS